MATDATVAVKSGLQFGAKVLLCKMKTTLITWIARDWTSRYGNSTQDRPDAEVAPA